MGPETFGRGTRNPPQSLKLGHYSNNSSFLGLFCSRQIYLQYGNKFPQIVGILSYILCSELIHHFREIFKVTIGVSNLVADEEIHATCAAAIMAALIHVENVEDISHHDLKADSQVG